MLIHVNVEAGASLMHVDNIVKSFDIELPSVPERCDCIHVAEEDKTYVVRSRTFSTNRSVTLNVY